MSIETLRFLLDVLCRQQISVGTDDFDTIVAIVAKAKTELLAAIATASSA